MNIKIRLRSAWQHPLRKRLSILVNLIGLLAVVVFIFRFGTGLWSGLLLINGLKLLMDSIKEEIKVINQKIGFLLEITSKLLFISTPIWIMIYVFWMLP